MRAKASGGQRERTFTESGRRAQIVDAAIEVIAELGYARASFARIAKRAGLSSTGMISYHFAGKDDLVRACAEEIVRVLTEFMRPRIDAAAGYAAKLRAYIESNVDIVGSRPAHLRALLEILNNARDADGQVIVDSAVVTSRAELFATHLRDGQRAGEFGAFDVWVMAHALTGAIDAVVGAHATGEEGEGPARDLERCGRELADAFERATAPWRR
ncbi:TetR family transcriptional regulator [Streptoalloteichus hindustanus]|uniref:Transcriptional regulator, TetR family n=1 Tax=Streptoalloteichus hindustanus TaxID=2017 RepID=A0A1M5MIH1_STRHI|nr:TetR family transcriptional regulator [Streptoalloteichus hindustanus]SHG77011.1 transcriptional regulator, TetR family [Streptoalloteichus hindustanus]